MDFLIDKKESTKDEGETKQCDTDEQEVHFPYNPDSDDGGSDYSESGLQVVRDIEKLTGANL